MNQYFIEQLIAAFQSSFWVVILCLLIGIFQNYFGAQLNGNFLQSTLGFGFVMAILYVFGIIVDCVAGAIFNKPQDIIKKEEFLKSLLYRKNSIDLGEIKNLDTDIPGSIDMLLKIDHSTQLADGFVYFRRTSRILSSTVINSSLLLLLLPFYLATIGAYSKSQISIVFLVLFIAILICSWKIVTKKYYVKVFETTYKYDELNKV